MVYVLDTCSGSMFPCLWGSNASFATTSAAFETLYDMMLGGLPEGWVDQVSQKLIPYLVKSCF